MRLKEELHERAEAMAVMRIEMKELQEAMSDLVVAVESERAEHARVSQSSSCLSQKNDELEKRVLELEGLVPKESEWTRLDELSESLEAKEKEAFDLSRANMVMEARLADLQRKLGEAMVHSAKIEESGKELEQRDMALEALKEQLAIEKGSLESVSESLGARESACSRLTDEKNALEMQLDALHLQLADYQVCSSHACTRTSYRVTSGVLLVVLYPAFQSRSLSSGGPKTVCIRCMCVLTCPTFQRVQEDLQQKEADLKVAQESIKTQDEDMQQRLKVKDSELQVVLADLAASRRLLESGLLEVNHRSPIICVWWNFGGVGETCLSGAAARPFATAIPEV